MCVCVHECVCVCVIAARRSSTARQPMSSLPMSASNSTSLSTTRHPCGGPQSVSVRFTNLFTVQSLYPTSQSSYFCHPSASLSIYLYISISLYICIYMYHPVRNNSSVCSGTNHVCAATIHINRTGQTSLVASFGGRITTSRRDEAIAATLCTRSPPIHMYIREIERELLSVGERGGDRER